MKKINLSRIVIASFVSSLTVPAFAAGYFKPHALMTPSTVSAENGRVFNDQTLDYQYKQSKLTGHVVNTQFAQDGGMAGCGIDTNLLKRVYGEDNYAAKNYIALNVYSRLMGFDANAPFWQDPEGNVKGYETFPSDKSTSFAYPNMQYHRIIPSLYPAYLGLFNNGYTCGRFVKVTPSSQVCQDETKDGISKHCQNEPVTSYANPFYGFVFDSCEDNNGWCRDDSAHIDINQAAIHNNYYLSWEFTKNPNYTSENSNPALKDVWLSWFGNSSKYWSYIALVNLEDGISKLEYNIGSSSNPVWVASHYLAGGNNVGWGDSSNNGQLWQVEPLNSNTDSGPANNPEYQIRIYNSDGYPFKNGAVYDFHLMGSDNQSMGEKIDANFTLFYAGNYTKGNPAPNLKNGPAVTRYDAPTGDGTVTVNFAGQLPNTVTAAAINPILISSEGFSYSASCVQDTCTFSQLPTNTSFTLFADSSKSDSNDVTLQRVHNVHIEKSSLKLDSSTKSLQYTLVPADINLNTTYTGAVTVKLWLTKTNTSGAKTVYAADPTKNFVSQVYFELSNNDKNLSAITQGCWLNSYVDADGKNSSTCYVYFTNNHQTADTFTNQSYSPTASFKVIAPKAIGADTLSGYQLTGNVDALVTVNGYAYNPAKSQTFVPVELKNFLQYNKTSAAERSLMLLVDPNSDSECVSSFSNVNVTVGGKNINFNPNQVGQLVETEISAQSPITASVTSSPDTVCYATLSKPLDDGHISEGSVVPGVDVVESIKLIAAPHGDPAPVAKRGIVLTASGDQQCLNGGNDTLAIESDSKSYAVSAQEAKMDLSDLALGQHTISDNGFTTADGGQCKLAKSVPFTLSDGFTNVSLAYVYKGKPPTPGACTVTQSVTHLDWGTPITQFHLDVSDSSVTSGKEAEITGSLVANGEFNQNIWGNFDITENLRAGENVNFKGNLWNPSFSLDGYINGNLDHPISALSINGTACTIK